jgi:HPt (histidine-containing phosphotransfer) domain-containing protein
MNSEPLVLDRSVLASSLGDDRELINEIYDLFRNTTDELIESLEKAAEDGDLGAVKRYAHSIKGSSANIGANALQHSMIEIEAVCTGENSAEVLEMVRLSKVEYSALLNELDSLEST